MENKKIPPSKDYLMAYNASCIQLYGDCEIGRQLIRSGYFVNESNKKVESLLKKLNNSKLSDREFIPIYNKFLEQCEKSFDCLLGTLKELKENYQGFKRSRGEYLRQLEILINND